MFKETICVNTQIELKINEISLVIRLSARDGSINGYFDND